MSIQWQLIMSLQSV